MIIIGTITFAEDLANAVAECYTTLPPVPDFVTVKGTYVYKTEGEPIRAFGIFEFDESRIDDATEYFKARYAAFSKVEGLKSKVEEWLSVEDALQVVEEGEFSVSTLSTGSFF